MKARKAAHNHGSHVSAASGEASPHTVSRAGVVAASLLLRPEAHRVIGAGSAIVTTGDGIGLRSGGFGPSRNPPARALIWGVAQHASGSLRRF